MLGLKGYKPDFSGSSTQFLEKHSTELQHLIGKSIESYYLQWDEKEGKWNEDGPIVLIINAKQHEFTTFKMDEYSMTINQIDLSQKLDWYGLDDEMPLVWKSNPLASINTCLNKAIEEIHILEYSLIADLDRNDRKKEELRTLTAFDFFIVGIELKLSGRKDCLQLSNGLDCNALKWETTTEDTKNRRVRVP